MSEANQTAPIDAREASMSRVTTLDKLVTPETTDPASEDPKAQAEEKQDSEGQKPKRGINERITQLVERRREAEAQAEASKREADELRARLEALQIKADPIEAGDKPLRHSFASDDEYVEALTDWKAQKAIADRERAQVEAQAKAESEAIKSSWDKRCVVAKEEIEDFEEVMASSDVQVSDVVGQALMRIEAGPKVAYFFAKHPDEAKKINRMHPIDAVRHLDRLANDLAGDELEAVKPAVKTSKAPKPIEPVKNSPALSQGPAESFEEHRARRMAEKKR